MVEHIPYNDVQCQQQGPIKYVMVNLTIESHFGNSREINKFHNDIQWWNRQDEQMIQHDLVFNQNAEFPGPDENGNDRQ